MRVSQICEKLEELLSARQAVEEKLAVAVDALSRIFGVQPNEVAIFSLDQTRDSLSFLWPKEMRSSGSIPFTANRSLVAVTAQERRSTLNNNFASTPHLFVFESFGKARTAPIQRIMSVPMLNGDDLRGVIQVSRKGEDTDTALRNFSETELTALSEMAKVMARHL